MDVHAVHERKALGAGDRCAAPHRRRFVQCTAKIVDNIVEVQGFSGGTSILSLNRGVEASRLPCPLGARLAQDARLPAAA